MKVKVQETGEIVSLGISDRNGINFVADFIGNTGAMLPGREFAEYDKDLYLYTADKSDVDWWVDVLDRHQHLYYVCDEIRKDLPEDISIAVLDIINQACCTDLDMVPGDKFINSVLAEHGYKMIIYSDKLIGFDKI